MQHMTAHAFAEDLRAGCLGTRIARLHRATSRVVAQQLQHAGVSAAQLEILTLLELRGAPTRPGEMAEILMSERSTISRNLALLEQRGFVAAAQRSATGRVMEAEATPAGQNALAAARQPWEAAQAQLLRALGPQAAAALDVWLDSLAESSEPS